MLAICVRQPWAWAIIHGKKDVENRSWVTSVRGRIAIVSSLRAFTDADLAAVARLQPNVRLFASAGVRGHCIGTVDLYEVRSDGQETDSTWAEEEAGAHWLLRDPRPCRPFAVRGRLRFFPIADELIARNEFGSAVKP
jgi:hypothetical protein